MNERSLHYSANAPPFIRSQIETDGTLSLGVANGRSGFPCFGLVSDCFTTQFESN
jgi:hypothetical protein